jgi:hypothetical protein
MALRASELLSHKMFVMSQHVKLNWWVRVRGWEHRSLRAGHPIGKCPEPFLNAIGPIKIVSRATPPKILMTKGLRDIQYCGPQYCCFQATGFSHDN